MSDISHRLGILGPTRRIEAMSIGISAPAGFLFIVEVDNGVTYYLVDSDGYYLVEPI